MNKACLFLLLVSIGCLYTAHAQQVKPFQFNDKKTIKISKKILEKLENKTWVVYKLYYETGKETKSYPFAFFSVKLNADSSFQAASSQRATSGSWSVEQKKVLRLIPKDSSRINEEIFIGGGYNIYKINDTELVLAKNLASDLKSRMIYYFKGSQSKLLTEAPTKPKNASSQPSSKDTKPIDDSRIVKALQDEIVTELFIRGLKAPKKLEKMTKEELTLLKKKILSGEYKE